MQTNQDWFSQFEETEEIVPRSEEKAPRQFSVGLEENQRPPFGFKEIKAAGRKAGRILGAAPAQAALNVLGEITGNQEELRQIAAGKGPIEPFFTPEDLIEKGMQTGSENILRLLALGGRGKALPLTFQGGIQKEIVKEAGGGPLAQFFAEMSPLAIQKLGTRALAATGPAKDFIKTAKDLGYSTKTISTLTSPAVARGILKSPIPTQKKLLKISEGIVRDAEAGIDRANVATSKLGVFPENKRYALIRSLTKKAKALDQSSGGSPQKAKTVKWLKREAKVLRRHELTGKRLSDMYRGANATFGAETPSDVWDLKNELVDIIGTKSKDVEKQYRFANEVAQRSYKMAEKLLKNTSGKRLDMSEMMAAILEAQKGRPGSALQHYLGMEGARELIAEAAVNPRARQLLDKATSSLAENKRAVAITALRALAKEVEKEKERKKETAGAISTTTGLDEAFG